MHALRCLAAALTAAGVVAVCAAPASAAPAFGATLTLDPSSGKAGTTITATFVVNAAAGTNCRLRVTYRWDSHVIGEDRSDSCVSKIKFRAPKSGREARPHEVTAVDSTTHQAAAAIFTILGADATATPTPTGGTPGATDTQPADVAAPADTGTAADPSPPAAHGNALPPAQPSSSLSAWALVFGGVLVLGGVAILALVILRMRRPGADPDEEEPLPQPSYAAPVTQTMPLPFGRHASTQRIEYPPPPGVPD